MEDSIRNPNENQLVEDHPQLPRTLIASYLLLNGIVIPNYDVENSDYGGEIESPFSIDKPFTRFRDGLWHFISASSEVEAGSRSMESLELEQLKSEFTLSKEVFFDEKAYFYNGVILGLNRANTFLLYYQEKPHSFIIFDCKSKLEFTMCSEENFLAFGISGMGHNSVHHQLEAFFTFEPEINRFGVSRDSFDETGLPLMEQKYERFLTDIEKVEVKNIWKVSTGSEFASYPN